MSELSCAQIVGSRTVAPQGETKEEEDTAKTIVAVACGFRQNDAFSLSPITMPLSISILTRVELDTTSEEHDRIVEAIADLLSRWHKYGDEMSQALTTEKFFAGELRMDGGTARIFDPTKATWSETISFSIRGSEKFIPADYYTRLVFNDGTTATLSTILDNDTFIALGYKSDMYTWLKQPTDLSVGSQNTEIPSYMFDNCWYLENVVIPDSITTIGNDSFSGCSVLTSVTIPESVVEIQNDAFYHSESISDVYCYANPNNLTWEDEESDDFIQTPPKATVCHVKFNYLSAFRQNFSDVNVTFVGDIDIPPETNVTYANGETAQFNITGFLMRDKIQNIGSVAEVTIGTNVTAIGDPTTQFADSTFSGCTSLVNVVIPSTVKSIGGYSFDGCTSLAHITIPKSVTGIQIAAFVRCPALMDVKFEGRTMAQVQAMSFYNWNLPSGCVIHCTDGNITI